MRPTARPRCRGAVGAAARIGLNAAVEVSATSTVGTTIATGMSPERHGILDFVTSTGNQMVPVSSRMRQADRSMVARRTRQE